MIDCLIQCGVADLFPGFFVGFLFLFFRLFYLFYFLSPFVTVSGRFFCLFCFCFYRPASVRNQKSGVWGGGVAGGGGGGGAGA